MHRSIPVVMTALGVATPTLAMPAQALAATTVKGTGYQYPFGALQVTISVSGKKLTGLSVKYYADNPRSSQLEAYALPTLKQEALKTHSYRINGVSGVTITSEVFDQSLYTAMRKAHLA